LVSRWYCLCINGLGPVRSSVTSYPNRWHTASPVTKLLPSGRG
jgi:hypothetical protein